MHGIHEKSCVRLTQPDNFSIRVSDSNLTEAHFRTVVQKLKAPGFWEDESLWQKVRAALPGYRLSKFQPLMRQGHHELAMAASIGSRIRLYFEPTSPALRHADVVSG